MNGNHAYDRKSLTEESGAGAIVGSWMLVSYMKQHDDGRVVFPFGRDPCGILTYSEDGFMSAQFMAKGRPPIGSNELFLASEKDLASSARGYFGYAGNYSVDLQSKVVYHDVKVSLSPNLVGTKQRREFIVSRGELQLTHGTGVITKLLWRKFE